MYLFASCVGRVAGAADSQVSVGRKMRSASVEDRSGLLFWFQVASSLQALYIRLNERVK